MLFIAVLCVIILCGAEIDLFVPSFPELMDVFNLSPFQVQLTLSSNFISQLIASFYVGSFGDIYGRRKIILWGLFIFLVGSILCVLSPIFSIMVLGRTLQGLGIAAPAVLGYVIIADRTPAEKQAGVLGVMNGFITIGMAGAPVVGSMIAKFYGWRGNFTALLILGMVGIIMTLLFIPADDKKTGEKPSFSLSGYFPLFKSAEFMRILILICLFTTCFWTFIGISPILYMKDLGVSINHFGFYQGSICAFFAIISLTSPKIMTHFTQDTCLRVACVSMLIVACAILVVGVCVDDIPMLITILMVLYCVNMVFPINILYPFSLGIVEGAKARASALVNVTKLCFAAFGVELMGYFYTGTFLPLSIFILLATAGSFLLVIKTQQWQKGVHFDQEKPAEGSTH